MLLAGFGLLVAAAPEAVSLTVEGPEELVLGDVDRVPVVLTVPFDAEAQGRPLRIAVNVGRFTPVQSVGDDRYRTIYELPSTRFPQVALVAVWRETGPDADIAFFRIPLSARTVLPVQAPSGAAVTVAVGARTFGPVRARRGRARVELVVPPGVEEVRVSSRRDGQVSQATVDAGVPPYNRLTLAVSPYKIPADGRSFATVHAFYDVVPRPPHAAIRLSAPAGTVERAGRSSRGYLFRYRPARGRRVQRVELTGRVVSDPASGATVDLELGLPEPERLVPRLPTTPWIADGVSRPTMSGLVTDAQGLGVDGLAVEATVGTELQPVQPVGQGAYEIQLPPIPPRAYPAAGSVAVQFRAGTRTATIAVPVAVPPWPTQVELRLPESVSAALFPVRIEARDASGAQFEGPLRLRAARAAVEPDPASDRRWTVQPESGAPDVDLEVVDAEGVVRLQRTVRLRGGGGFDVGVRAGTLVSGDLLWLAGLELGWRPGWLDGRWRWALRGSVFRRQQDFEVDLATDRSVEARAALWTVPISGGITVDVWRAERWSIYGGGLATAAIGIESVRTDFADPQRRTLVFPGGEAVLGAVWSGWWVELSGGGIRVQASDLDAPDLGFAFTVGGRLD
jgi:hypothetical protein